MAENDETSVLTIGRAEALVLFEMLADFHREPSLPIRNSAERLALIRLHGALEKSLVEIFAANYNSLLEEAQAKLAAQFGED
jgi:hypothetical protein